MTQSTTSACPPIQAVSPATISGVLHLIESGTVTDGPIGAFDRERGIFLIAVVTSGVVVAWTMSSCASEEAAARERKRVTDAAAVAAMLASPEGQVVVQEARAMLFGDTGEARH